ncbi:MAG: glutamine synthetase family protein [Solirubrobacterales bacterium]
MTSQDPVALDRSRSNGGSSPDDAAAVMEQIRSGEITTVIVGGCDFSGLYRAKRMPADRFAAKRVPGLEFSEYMWAMDVDDYPQPTPEGFEGWPDWKTGFGDVEARADLETLRRVPWLERTAMVLCDYYYLDGSQYATAPRQVLRRILKRYEDQGLEPRMAPELEFIVFKETEESAIAKGFRNLEPLFQHPMAYGGLRGTIDEHLIGDLVEGLRRIRVPVEAWNPEGAAGQYELNIPHATALEAADVGFLFKQGIKEMCGVRGLIATFMSKLTAADFGSSLHVHQSVWRDGESTFFDGSREDGMSDLLRHYVAGQLRTLIPFAPIWMPTPPAFKRGGAYTAAGTTESWGGDNKTLSLRVLAHEAGTCRLEHRVAGADANIYLTLAAMLAGGLWGIEKEVELPPAYEGDAYADPSLPTMPRTLEDAIPAFEQSEVANEYLGEDFVRRYAATRRWEVEELRKDVSDLELKRYLIRG